MPLSAESLIQANSGSFNATSGNATLASTTAGNVVILAIGTQGTNDVAVSGFTRATTAAVGGSQRGGIFVKATAGGETSFAITVSSAQPTVWAAYEAEGVDVDNPVDVTRAWSFSDAPAQHFDTGRTDQSTTYDGIVLAMCFVPNLVNTTVPPLDPIAPYTDSAFTTGTDGWAEVGQYTRVEASTAYLLATAVKPTLTLGLFGCVTNISYLSVDTYRYGAGVVVLTATGAKRAPRIDAMCGFETGTVAGITTGVAGYAPWDSSAGTPAVVSTSPRSGTYCLELSSSAATEHLTWTSAGALGVSSALGDVFTTSTWPTWVVRFAVCFPTSLPAGDVDLFSLGTGAVAGACVLRYRTSGTKLGMKVSATGTEQFSGAVVADTWYGIDVRFSVATSTWTAQWQVDGVDQTDATLGGQAVTVLTLCRFGWATSATATVRYDDIAVSRVPGHYPLGDLKIYPLKVDPAGTLTVSLSGEANFKTFTSNGTLAAWDATVARGAIDEIPPTIGASADGLTQVTASSAAVNIPMETYTVGAAEVIRAVRWYWCGWAAAATTNHVMFQMSHAVGFYYTAFSMDPAFDNSTTTPGWVCRMHRDGGPNDQVVVWDQTMLDLLSCEVGSSTDATPDVGIHAVLAEVAVRTVPAAQPLFGDLATATRDPDSGGVVELSLTAPAGYDTDLYYEESGTPTTVPVTGGTTETAAVTAPDVETTNYIAAYPAAEPEPSA
jgi:hypothetical protein